MPRKSKGSGTSMIKDLAFKHKVFLESLGIDYNNYLFVSKGADYYRFMDKHSKRIFDIRR